MEVGEGGEKNRGGDRARVEVSGGRLDRDERGRNQPTVAVAVSVTVDHKGV